MKRPLKYAPKATSCGMATGHDGGFRDCTRLIPGALHHRHQTHTATGQTVGLTQRLKLVTHALLFAPFESASVSARPDNGSPDR